MNKPYLGTNFDNFLKEENIEITSEEVKRNAIRKYIDKELKSKCLDFFNQPISEDSAEILKNNLRQLYHDGRKQGKLKKSRLPRKLKKQMKKYRKVEITFTIEPTQDDINALNF